MPLYRHFRLSRLAITNFFRELGASLYVGERLHRRDAASLAPNGRDMKYHRPSPRARDATCISHPIIGSKRHLQHSQLQATTFLVLE